MSHIMWILWEMMKIHISIDMSQSAKPIQEISSFDSLTTQFHDSLSCDENKPDFRKLNLASPVSPLRTRGSVANGALTSSSSSSFSGSASAKNSSNTLSAGRFETNFGEIEIGPIGFNSAIGRSRGFALFVYKTTRKAKGYGFVLFTTRKSALKALQNPKRENERARERERSVWRPRK